MTLRLARTLWCCAMCRMGCIAVGIPAQVSTEEDAVTVSVVVIGRNEGPRLARCLESIGLSEEQVLEVIYVDSGSSDGSPALAETFGVRVHKVIADRPTAALGRNVGWRAAQG